MNVYLRDTLLVMSVIGAPIIFLTLLYYGLTSSDRRNKRDRAGDKPQSGSDKGPEPAPPVRDPKANSA